MVAYLYLILFLDKCIIQKLRDKVASEDLFMLKHCPDKHKTQEMFDKVVDSYLLALKFVTDWCFASKMIEKLDSAVLSDIHIVFCDLDSDIVRFFSSDIALNSITVDNNNLDDSNFDYFDPETISYVRRMDWYNGFKQRKTCKKR